jgi:arginine decarboxylase
VTAPRTQLIGNRVPRDFFVTKGTGESDITIHAGSYHLALRECGVEMANIMTYSSILPKNARQVLPRPYEIVHGEVMECIEAAASCQYGEVATAGIIFGWLYTKEGERYGGLVCEYNGSLDEAHARGHLKEMINELHTNGYEHLYLRDIEVHTSTVTPEKMYGTALVMLCFVNYEIPLLEETT